MTTEYKPKNDIPDLYNILGLTIDVCKEPNCNELIQKAYVRKAKICHPDKHPGRKDVEEVFELLTQAYDILKDEKERTNYNHKLSLNKQSSSDFIKLKKAASEHMETLGEYKPPTDTQKISFKEQMKAIDSKHGYDSNSVTAISQQDAKKKLSELASARRVDDENLMPEKLFEGPMGAMDKKKFNEAFDKIHNRDDGTSIMQHNGFPSAWNDFGSSANFCSFDNLDNLYVNEGNRFDTSRQVYGSVDFSTPSRKITKDEIQNLKGADYYDGHKIIGDDYYKEMKEKLKSRKGETDNFEKMKYGDFKKDDTGGYGIFDQLGFKYDDRLSLDMDEDDISKKLEKIMAERQKDLLLGATNTNTNIGIQNSSLSNNPTDITTTKQTKPSRPSRNGR